ncbi:DUF397 domain-containing protein [Streptomyces gobiensis]|uniref:DUF397 domain-containing protein n=1 Tax=Streptomyces gobiensis TaxID=2875706 RepID=UPI001E5A3BCD|nr:DUF397 domain-containing protein [Streptomyces gobiensis]UGY92799.1 DUF397 domain-containing protein [Streptomyces gobiensis]
MSKIWWQKSSYSASATDCLEIATGAEGSALVRESDDPDVIVNASHKNLQSLILGVKLRKFDHLR